MKISRFNYFLNYRDKNVLYNTLSRKLLLLDPMLVDLIQAAENENKIDNLNSIHPSLYHKLIEDRFIIENEKDETEDVKKIMKAIDGDESHYYLIINPTMNCNFKCWYCYETHIKESRMNEKTIYHIIKHLTNVIQKKKEIKRITVGWFGGEPLLYFNNIMLPIMQQAKALAEEYEIYFSQNITTNGFLIKDTMMSYFRQYNLTSFQITLDGNKELHDTIRFVSKNRGSYDDIMSNIKLLLQNRLSVSLRINYTESTLKNIENIYNDLEDIPREDLEYLNISFHQVWQDNNRNLNDRVDQLIEFFRSKGIEGNNSYIPNTLYGSCYADKINHATINYDGNVFKCTARDFNENNREGILKENGEIDWEEKYYTRMEIKLKNRPCQSCKILPMCNGGCSQIAIEAEGKDFCVYDYDENIKKDIVFRKVESILMANVPS